MSYSDKSIQELIRLADTEESWKDVTNKWNMQFSDSIGNRSLNALRKLYKRTIITLKGDENLDDGTILKSLQSAQRQATINRVLSKQNRVLSDNQISYNEFLDKFKQIINNTQLKVHKQVKSVKRKEIRRTIVGHISDTHIGVRIDKKEMGGSNSFNPKLAARRFAYYFNELSNYKIEHRAETDLVLVLNGDILAGIIHSQEFGVDLMATQFANAISILSQGISFVSQRFNNIKIYCVTGNHDRYVHKDNIGRQSDHKWDSFATNLYVALREVFKKDKTIEFIIPETPYALFKIFNHNIIASHGDTFINLGNPGKSINTKDITSQVNNISVGLGIKIDVLMGGHVHKATYQSLDNGTELVINGTLSGTDAFAQSIGITSNHPTQQLLEVTQDHAVGDMRFIRLINADNDQTLDKIIEPLLTNF